MTEQSATARQARPSVAFVIATVLLPFGCGYFLSYLYRTVNVVLAPRLAHDLGLTASDLGLLTSVYFIAFAAFQTPLGVLLDRYGPRRVQGALLLVAGAGAVLFAAGGSFLPVTLGRALIGLGVSGCLMAAFKANVMWFPAARLPLVNGVIVAFGSCGALAGTVPVEAAAQAIGWRGVFWALAALTVAVVAGTLLVVPERPGQAGGTSFRRQVRDLRLIYGNPFFWRVSVVAVLQTGVFLGYQTLWMGPWLRDVALMGPRAVAETLFLFNVGMLAGVLGIGLIAERLQAVGIKPVVVIGVGILASMATQALLALEAAAYARALCVAFGFFGSSSLLVYAVLGQAFPAHLVGRVNTANNMLAFLSAFAVQWGVGAIINLWPAGAEGRYDPAGHQAALFAVLAVEAAAFLWFLWPRRREAPVPR